MYLNHSPVMDYADAVDFLAGKVFHYGEQRGEKKPYIAVVGGFPGIGKTHFCRDIVGKLAFQKKGAVTKPHDLEQCVRQYGKGQDYYLIENHDAHYMLIDNDSKRILGKVPDIRIFMVRQLSGVLNPPELTLEKMLECFNLIVENHNCSEEAILERIGFKYRE